MLTTTRPAPAVWAAWASARILSGSIWFAAHGASAGSGMPLKPY
jgi:hypothetical protein